MDLKLKNKTALITGSSKGIGKAIAKALYDEECNVILNGRNLTNLKSAAKTLGKNVDYFVADVTKPKSCNSLINNIMKHHGKLDILICNVGSGKSVPPGKENSSEWEKMFEINLSSATNIISAAQKILTESNGTIVCISSIAGLEATGAPIAYSSAKAALNAYVHEIARPLAQNGIRINAVALGNIIFKGSVWEKKLRKNPRSVKKMLKDVPLHRLGKPNEVASIVTFLASPLASFITGSIYVVDGGQIKS